MKKLFLFMLVCSAGLTVLAQAPSRFYFRFGGNGYDVGYDVKQTLDKGYIIAGSTNSFGLGNTDMYMVKLDSMGQKKIETTFGGYNNDIGRSVIQLADSGYAMVGYTNSSGFGGYDIFLVRTDKNGILLWQKTLGGSDWDFANSLQETADGGLILAGSTYSYGRGNADGYVIKTDAGGNIQWTKTYGGKYDDEFKAVIQTTDGGYALTGNTKSYTDTVLGDAWTFKLDVAGDSSWCKIYSGTKEDYGRGIIQLQNSDLTIAGGTKSSSVGGNNETLLISYDYITGNETFFYVDVSSQQEYYNDMAQGLNGSFAGCGLTRNTGYGNDALVDIYSTVYGTVNFFSKGSLLEEEFYAITPTKDKGFAAVGVTNGFGAILDDVFFMKMDSIGNYGISIVGVKENQSLTVQPVIYPNPASGILNLKINNYEDFNELRYAVTDMNGNLVSGNQIYSFETQVNIGNIANGLYVIQLFEKGMLLHTQKISVIK